MSSDNDPQVELLATPPDARDVTTELAAPPRRKLPWLTLVLAGGVIATLSFAGGVWYEQGNGKATTSTPRAQGQGGFGGYGGGYGGQGGTRRNGAGTGQNGQGGAGFTRGTVKAVDGSTVYLTDANGNTVKVTTADTTKVQLNKEGKVSDLQPGQTVTVVGTPDSSGGYAATQLTEGAATGGFPGARSSSNG
ncbi:hypothetical protein GCM10010193_13930 [Kitasatospora atroaurantiaca]|uniref:Uncharacterized protein n=1 Tax=Kitasatospora atroaurantiaca TaxID=285545 RepID=A0A561ESX7_9ACTN|nr:DUF5666 domain-containing protein [Kitasatospora atroaurantiaca]TWE18727.1 hypothetical protein FB465_3815 [Kitasatospora atroaurantiaca]